MHVYVLQKYNPPGSDVHVMATTLQEIFDSKYVALSYLHPPSAHQFRYEEVNNVAFVTFPL